MTYDENTPPRPPHDEITRTPLPDDWAVGAESGPGNESLTELFAEVSDLADQVAAQADPAEAQAILDDILHGARRPGPADGGTPPVMVPFPVPEPCQGMISFPPPRREQAESLREIQRSMDRMRRELSETTLLVQRMLDLAIEEHAQAREAQAAARAAWAQAARVITEARAYDDDALTRAAHIVRDAKEAARETREAAQEILRHAREATDRGPVASGSFSEFMLRTGPADCRASGTPQGGEAAAAPGPRDMASRRALADRALIRMLRRMTEPAKTPAGAGLAPGSSRGTAGQEEQGQGQQRDPSPGPYDCYADPFSVAHYAPAHDAAMVLAHHAATVLAHDAGKVWAHEQGCDLPQEYPALLPFLGAWTLPPGACTDLVVLLEAAPAEPGDRGNGRPQDDPAPAGIRIWSPLAGAFRQADSTAAGAGDPEPTSPAGAAPAPGKPEESRCAHR
jgi:hypothetical protein